MGLDEFIEGDSDVSDETDITEDNNENKESDPDNQYEAYAELDEELDAEVAAIVDEVIEQWGRDNMVDLQLHDEYVRVRRPDLVYGIVNIVKRTQHYFEDEQ